MRVRLRLFARFSSESAHAHPPGSAPLFESRIPTSRWLSLGWRMAANNFQFINLYGHGHGSFLVLVLSLVSVLVFFLLDSDFQIARLGPAKIPKK
jgi:hypothetical protein